MTALIIKKRIDLIVDLPLIPKIVAIGKAAGIEHHTVLSALSGIGTHGSWSDDRISGAMAKANFMTICSAEHAESFVAALEPLLSSYRMIITVTDVGVVRGSHF
jgi:hypothetical protein